MRRSACIAAAAVSAALAAAAVYLSFEVASLQSELNESRGRVSLMENGLSAHEAARRAEEESAVEAASGLSAERARADEARIREMLKLAFDWDSYDEYVAAREALRDEWGLPEDSGILKDYMPPVAQATRDDGELYNPIDQEKLDLRLKDMQAFVTSIEGGVYRYLCVCEVVGHGVTGYAAEGEVAVTCATLEDGTIAEVEATGAGIL